MSSERASEVPEPMSVPSAPESEADANIRYWAGPSAARAPVVIRDGRVNFRCLAEKCPTPCCGPFEGLGESLAPCFVSSFSDLYLLPEDVDRLLKAGRGDLLEHGPEGYRLRLKADKSCAAFDKGLCTIHRIRPAVCRAFPFDFDMFAGLVMITKCPGVNAGWSEPEEFAESIDALRKVYEGWIDGTVRRVEDAVARASDAMLTEADLPPVPPQPGDGEVAGHRKLR